MKFPVRMVAWLGLLGWAAVGMATAGELAIGSGVAFRMVPKGGWYVPLRVRSTLTDAGGTFLAGSIHPTSDIWVTFEEANQKEQKVMCEALRYRTGAKAEFLITKDATRLPAPMPEFYDLLPTFPEKGIPLQVKSVTLHMVITFMDGEVSRVRKEYQAIYKAPVSENAEGGKLFFEKESLSDLPLITSKPPVKKSPK